MNQEDYIKELELQKHPEGGFFKETYRSSLTISMNGFEGDRNFLTSIYFLLEANQVSHFHRIKSDELWYFHGGSPCRVHQIDVNGNHSYFDLGIDLHGNQRPFTFVPSGNIFGAEPLGTFTLVSCAVAPGFDFQDFTLLTTPELMRLYPKHEQLIKKFSKEKYQ